MATPKKPAKKLATKKTRVSKSPTASTSARGSSSTSRKSPSPKRKGTSASSSHASGYATARDLRTVKATRKSDDARDMLGAGLDDAPFLALLSPPIGALGPNAQVAFCKLVLVTLRNLEEFDRVLEKSHIGNRAAVREHVAPLIECLRASAATEHLEHARLNVEQWLDRDRRDLDRDEMVELVWLLRELDGMALDDPKRVAFRAAVLNRLAEWDEIQEERGKQDLTKVLWGDHFKEPATLEEAASVARGEIARAGIAEGLPA